MSIHKYMYMGIHEYTRVYMGIHEHTWVYTSIHGYTRVYMSIHGYTLSIHEYTQVYVHGYTRHEYIWVVYTSILVLRPDLKLNWFYNRPPFSKPINPL